jgi:hypothetical protein
MMLKGFTETPGMVEAVGQEKADEHQRANFSYNAARDNAELEARKTARSEREVIEAVRKNPDVAAKLAVAQAIVSDERVPSAAREQVATALIATDNFEAAAQLSA